ncbi:hypothetical protein RB653_009886 [Dictyostelium firmibasis]|uniref:EGF-like domain-containing protein n=1 Tax=Dictyostelium firmibasis TaxID=79012 RepID=A0AAN7TSX1_9MYCE
MKQCFLLIFFIFCVIKFSIGIEPPPNELNALNNLVQKFNLSLFGNPPDYCLYLTCNSETGAIIGSLFLFANSANYTPNGAKISKSDLIEFSSVSSLLLEGFSVENEFFFYKLPNIGSLSYVNLKGTIEINQTLPAYMSLYIDCPGLDEKNFKLSYISSETESLQIFGGNIIMEVDPPIPNKLRTFYLSTKNLPDFKNIPLDILIIQVVDGFNTSSLESFNRIRASTITFIDQTKDNSLVLPSEFLRTRYYSTLKIYSDSFRTNFLAPIDNEPIDLSNITYYYLYFQNAGNLFNIQKDSKYVFPILTGNKTAVLKFANGKISQIEPLSQFGKGRTISVTYSGISGGLGLYNGTNKQLYDFSNNYITGTIDESWCNTELIIYNNEMNGTIPSCYTCYFKYALHYYQFNVNIYYDAFKGNNFTNLDINIECTTFAPQIQKSTMGSFYVYGKDIGFYGDKYLINDTINCISYKIIEFGKKYECMLPLYSLTQVNYFKINFIFPHDRDYYFPLIKRSPIISSVSYSNNVLYINGSYFSSYLGHVPQSINLLNSSFDISNSSDFFSIQAKQISTSILQEPNTFNLLTLNTNSMITKVLINSTSSINNKLCNNDCTDIDHGICNLYLGTCVCDNGWFGDDCSISNIFISSVEPSTTNGGEAAFIGTFIYDFSEASLTIGGLDCQITFNSTNLIKCIAPPGNGIKTVILKQNNKIFTGTNIYKYKEIILSCPNKCSNNGICNTSTAICNCNNGYSLYDCSAQINTDTGGSGSGTNTTIDPNTGSTNITNSQTHFQVYIKSLIEVDLNNNIIKSYSLLSDWTFNKTENEIEPNKYILKQQLKNNNSSLNSNGCIVTSIIEEIKDKNGKEFTFAGTSFIVSSGSIKFTISIANYTYQNNLNTLKLELISSVVDNIDKINNDCNSKDTEIDTSNVNDLSTFNYIKISKNNKIFSGRFINKVISDGRPTFFTTNSRNNSNSIIVTLNLPHCVNECLIDPDFSVLISNDFSSECNDDDSSRKWLIPVAVVVPVVGAAFLFVVFFILYKKSTTMKIIIHASKLKKINN